MSDTSNSLSIRYSLFVKMATNKIVKYGVEKDALRLKAEGKTNAQISRILSDKCKKHITQMSVGRFFQAEHEALTEEVNRTMQKNEELQVKKAETHLDAISQLTFINGETLNILRSAKQSHDFKTALKAIERVEKQLELQARLLGEISEQPQTIIFSVQKAEVNV